MVDELPEYNMDYFDIKESDGIISQVVKAGLEEFIKNELSSIGNKLNILSLTLPWKRMFEVDMDVEYVD